MSQNNNQEREQASLNQPNEEQTKLEAQLRESVVAEDFFNLASGKLWVQQVQEEVNKILKEITSDKFLKDHQGYVNALADLRANQKILRKMQVAASPIRRKKIQEKLEEEDDGTA